MNPLLSFGNVFTAIQVGSIAERRPEHPSERQVHDGLRNSLREPPLMWCLEKKGEIAALSGVEALLNRFLSM